MLRGIPESHWSALSHLVAQRIGLHFPPERRDDLQRGLGLAAKELGFDDLGACAAHLLSTPPTAAEIRVLATHLTIGETYFFRDGATLDALTRTVLPELIRARQGGERRLRLWSAACCSGEEAYSLAILVHELLPDPKDWQVTITATDINPRFLLKANAGVYGEWSFRNCPAGLKQRYFRRTADKRFAIVPEIKAMVEFAPLNLVEDAYPSLVTHTQAMDVILCRNVLMYFTPAQMAKVVGKLHDSLREGGWLAVSPSEASPSLFAPFAVVSFPGASLFHKSARAAAPTPAATPAWAPAPAWAAWAPVPGLDAVADIPAPSAPPLDAPAPPAAAAAPKAAAAELSRQARALANQGRLADAQASCLLWLALDKLDPAAHYLHAVVLLEQGEVEQARASLQRSIYLDHDFVVAHFALGNLARRRGRHDEAARHLGNARDGLRRYAPEALLPEADGMTAGRLAEAIATMTAAVPAR